MQSEEWPHAGSGNARVYLQFLGDQHVLDLDDLGVKGAAIAALGENVGAGGPFVSGWPGVNDGESTLKRLFMLHRTKR